MTEYYEKILLIKQLASKIHTPTKATCTFIHVALLVTSSSTTSILTPFSFTIIKSNLYLLVSDLVNTVMSDFAGPFCQEVGLSLQQLPDIDSIKAATIPLKNGLIFEINSTVKDVSKVILVLTKLQPTLHEYNIKTIRQKITRLLDTKKKLLARKKVKGVSSLDELKQIIFQVTS